MSRLRKLRGPRYVARRSSIHGKGVFARLPIKKGELISKYRGVLITEEEADALYPDVDDDQPNHTFLFLIEGGMIIDGNRQSNASRWINHSCSPNCETSEDEDGRIYIEAIRNIAPGDELTYDYNLVLDGRPTAKERKRFVCHCGARNCRGTMLGGKTGKRPSRLRNDAKR